MESWWLQYREQIRCDFALDLNPVLLALWPWAAYLASLNMLPHCQLGIPGHTFLTEVWIRDIVCIGYVHAQSYLTPYDPMDCSPSYSSVHGDSPGENTGVGCHALL